MVTRKNKTEVTAFKRNFFPFKFGEELAFTPFVVGKADYSLSLTLVHEDISVQKEELNPGKHNNIWVPFFFSSPLSYSFLSLGSRHLFFFFFFLYYDTY